MPVERGGFPRILAAAVGLGLAQIPFIINLFWSLKHGEKVGTNPWEATTLDWHTPTPPPHGNFPVAPQIVRGPYEYNAPGFEGSFAPQAEFPAAPAHAPGHHAHH